MEVRTAFLDDAHLVGTSSTIYEIEKNAGQRRKIFMLFYLKSGTVVQEGLHMTIGLPQK